MQPRRKRDLPYEVTPTNIPGAFASVGALEDFDPRMASTAALISQGLLWRRPGPGDDATLRAAWERTFSRVWCPQDRTVPHLEPQIGRTHNLRHAKRTTGNSFTSRNWAGASIEGTWTSVTGHWVIPTVSQPGEPQGSEGGWNSSSWVGIDGTYGSDDILQAGVEQRVNASGNTSYVAWCEWFAPHYPNSPSYIFQTNISNFAVSPGDTVYCSVQYDGPMVPPAAPAGTRSRSTTSNTSTASMPPGTSRSYTIPTALADRKMAWRHFRPDGHTSLRQCHDRPALLPYAGTAAGCLIQRQICRMDHGDDGRRRTGLMLAEIHARAVHFRDMLREQHGK